MPGSTVTPPRRLTCAPSRAARELGLKRGEFDLAVHLGRIRTVPDEDGGGRRVARAEIDRLCSAENFPETLQGDVATVGTAAGAALLRVPTGRFTRLARLGLVAPVKLYVNRYRAVVWLYLAAELRQFGADGKRADLLTGRMPEELRGRLGAGLDLRPRNWRGRHLGFLLRQTDDPWERAGAVAAFLEPAHVADVVPDAHERAHLNRFRPGPPVHGRPGSPSAHLAEKIMTADQQDEIGWLRSELARVVDEARAQRSAPRSVAPVVQPPPRPAPVTAHSKAATPRCGPPAARAPERPRGLLDRLRGGSTRRARARALRLEGPEQALLDDRHEQAPLSVVDTTAGQPAATGRDR
ncbi:DUF6397 family protein [Streptomyces sp. NPDC002514]|uniref:DUF6397 family protein n=1 Tax=Streptomyces sp. NPDC001270 TaxID=3364554 RepID=UPI003686E8DF